MSLSGQPEIQIEQPFKDCLSLTGQRQCGKTKLLGRLIKHNPNPILIFDTLSVLTNDILKGKLVLRPNQKIINPRWSERTLPSYEERLRVFLPICEGVWKRGNVIFIVEEWHLFCKTKFALPPEFGNLFNQGGNRNIALWGTSQRPAQVHNDILAAVKHHLIFSLWMPQDLRWMQNFIPKRYVESDNPQDLTIATLQPYHFFYYNTQTKKAEFYQPITI